MEMNEIVALLREYLESSANVEHCAEWCAGVDWSDPELTVAEKETVGTLELLITEVAEGLREEEEVRAFALGVVERMDGRVLNVARTESS